MQISKVTTNGNWWVPGDTATISFTLKNTSGSKIKKMYLAIVLNKQDFDSGIEYTHEIPLSKILGSSHPYPAAFTLANNASKAFSATFTITNEIADLFAQYPTIRSVPIYATISATISGNYGISEFIRLDGISMVNKRYSPQISEFNAYRAEKVTAEDGTVSYAPDEEGESLITSIRLTDSADGSENFFTAKMYYSPNAPATTDSEFFDLTSKIPALLDGVYADPDLMPVMFSNGIEWRFLLVFGDEFESISLSYRVSRAFANLHLSGAATGGACFGGFSSSVGGDPKLESYYPFYAYAGIYGVNRYPMNTEIPDGLWHNGEKYKPRYKKTIPLQPVSAGSNLDHSLNTGAIETLIFATASGGESNGDWYPIPYSASGATYQTVMRLVDALTDDPKIRISVQENGRPIVKGHATIFFTKVNDAAVETDTHLRLVDADDFTVIDAYGNTLMSRR